MGDDDLDHITAELLPSSFKEKWTACLEDLS
jgi:hypothetical protein